MRTRKAFRTHSPLPALVLIAGLALSVLAAAFTRQEIASTGALRLRGLSAIVAQQVERRLAAHAQALVGLRALFHTADAVDADRFHRYVNGLAIASGLPGLHTLDFAPCTSEAQGAQLRSCRILYVEPLASKAALAGKDLALVPAMRALLERSRDAGALSADLSGNPAAGEAGTDLALRLPLYRSAVPPGSVQARRADFVGTVGAAFRLAPMLADVAPSAETRVRLLDAGPLPLGPLTDEQRREVRTRAVPDVTPRLVFDSRPQGMAGSVLRDTQDFSLAARRWVVEVSASEAALIGPVDRFVPWAVFGGGVLASLLFAAIVEALSSSRVRAVGIARRITRTLRANERRLADAQRLAGVGSWTLALPARTVRCSAEAGRIYGLPPTSAPFTIEQLLANVPVEERESLTTAIDAVARQGGRSETEHRVLTPTGLERWVHVVAEAGQEEGHPVVNGTARDHTDAKRAALRLAALHAVNRALAAESEPEAALPQILAALCGMLSCRAGGFWQRSGEGAARCLHTWRKDLPAGPGPDLEERSFFRPRHALLGRAWAAGEPVLEGDCLVLPLGAGRAQAAFVLLSEPGREPTEDSLAFLRSAASQTGEYLQRKEAENTLVFMANHDALTGLANRLLLRERVAHAIRRAHRFGKRPAVLFMDLDRFKFINDTLGHSTGDALLRACAERLCMRLRDTDTVARFGGDEFVVLVEDLDASTDVLAVVNKILTACAEPFHIEGRELHVSASLGIAVYPEDGADPEALLKNADAAMYRAKEKGRATYQFYSAQMQEQGAERFLMETELRHALEREQLFLLYQPKLDLATGRIVGVEALMRWQHPTLGLVSPAQFVPIAEDTGLIEAMGRWALDAACREAARVRDAGYPVLMSVNLSARQLNRASLLDEVSQALAASGLDPSLLELEITESGVMQNPLRATALLTALRALGVSLAIDDFGTGYSSLSYLKRFPFSTLKVDRSFIKDLPGDGDAAALTSGIIALAHGLHMQVVAEGVETAAQLDFLRANRCDQMQGYLLSKPLASPSLEKLLAEDLRHLMPGGGTQTLARAASQMTG